MAELAGSLLARAADVYDAAENGLQPRAARAAARGFASAAEWMGLALAVLRDGRRPGPAGRHVGYQRLGIIKYGLAGGAALAWAMAAVWVGVPWLVPGALLVF